MVSEKNGKKKNLRGHFWELLYELQNRIWDYIYIYIYIYIYCIKNVYILCKDWHETRVKGRDAQGGITNK